MVSVDGDTSTNDTVAVLASGLCENDRIETENDDYFAFVSALNAICEKLQAIEGIEHVSRINKG